MKTRVALDSNIYLAAAVVPTSHAAKWLRSASRADRGYDVFASEPLLNTVTLDLQTKFGVHNNDVIAFVRRIRMLATFVDQAQATERARDDKAVLACAVTSKADLIITANRALLEQRQYRGIGIYHPSNLRYLFPAEFERVG